MLILPVSLFFLFPCKHYPTIQFVLLSPRIIISFENIKLLVVTHLNAQNFLGYVKGTKLFLPPLFVIRPNDQINLPIFQTQHMLLVLNKITYPQYTYFISLHQFSLKFSAAVLLVLYGWLLNTCSPPNLGLEGANSISISYHKQR